MASKLDFPEMTDAHWRSMEARWISMDLTDDADELIDTTAYLTKCRKFREQSIDWLIKDNQKKELKELSRNYGTERKVRKLKSLLTVWRQKRDEKKMSIEDKGSMLRSAPKCDAITSPTQTATSSNSTDMPTQTSQFPPSPISRSSSANDIWNDVTILPSSPSPVKLPPVSVPLPLSSKLPSSVPKPSSASKPQNPKTTQSPSLSKPQKPAPSLHRTIKDSTPALTPLIKKNLKKSISITQTLNTIPRPLNQIIPPKKPQVSTSIQRPTTHEPSQPRQPPAHSKFLKPANRPSSFVRSFKGSSAQERADALSSLFPDRGLSSIPKFRVEPYSVHGSKHAIRKSRSRSRDEEGRR